MARDSMILLMDELLEHRRHYFARRKASQTEHIFTDVDCVVAHYLLSRLKIARMDVDDSSIAGLFRNDPPAEQSYGVHVLGDGDGNGALPQPPATADPEDEFFNSLFVFRPGQGPGGPWLAAAAEAGSLCMCYGLQGALGGEFSETLGGLFQGTEEGMAVPLFGIAPGLWRSASMLIFRRSRRPVVMDALRQLISAFSCDEMDAVQVIEENLKLRETIRRLSTPGSSKAEIDKLKSIIINLENELVSLRRAALHQEQELGRRNG